jgi:hypothetical protein
VVAGLSVVVIVDVVVVVCMPVVAGVSVDIVEVVIVSDVPVSSTTCGCSVVVVSAAGSSAFLQAPRKRVAVAVAAIRNNARDFFMVTISFFVSLIELVFVSW